MHGVNITLLSPLRMISKILDTSPATPGILLIGCRETQNDVDMDDSLQIKDGTTDPWVYSIVQVIKNRVLWKRGIPSYTALFDESYGRIRKCINEEPLTGWHLAWPSVDDMPPALSNTETGIRNRDPQLVFDKGYIDPDTQRFLFPLASLDSGSAIGELVRYPHDEL